MNLFGRDIEPSKGSTIRPFWDYLKNLESKIDMKVKGRVKDDTLVIIIITNDDTIENKIDNFKM
jgi:hypothetical protein